MALSNKTSHQNLNLWKSHIRNLHSLASSFGRIVHLLAIIAGVLITGCSSTTVHLYGKYLDPQQVQQTTELLEQKGYTVQVNDFVFPDAIHASTLLYSINVTDGKQLDNLTRELMDAGWPIYQIFPMQIANHWITKNDLGLFLLPEGLDPAAGKTMADIAGDYRAAPECGRNIQLILYSNGNFEVVTDGEQFSGLWRVTDFPYIELSRKMKVGRLIDYYQVERLTQQDLMGTVKITQLTSLQGGDDYSSCTLQLGVRQFGP